MSRRRRGGPSIPTLGAFLTAALLLAAAAPAAAAERTPESIEAARGYFTDVELVDQHGDTQRLYSDLMDGKVVAITSMFTTCAAVCPVLTQKMERLQQAAGDRLGDDVHLLSISVDPETDTPAKLRAYAERFDAADGWYFLTGPAENVETALAKLGYAVEDKDAHSTVILMGNEQTGLWKKTNGLSSGDSLVEIFRGVLADGGNGGAGGGADDSSSRGRR